MASIHRSEGTFSDRRAKKRMTAAHSTQSW